MTLEEKLDAFITTTNERLDRMESKLDFVVKSLTVPPDLIEQMEASLTTMRKLREMPLDELEPVDSGEILRRCRELAERMEAKAGD